MIRPCHLTSSRHADQNRSSRLLPAGPYHQPARGQIPIPFIGAMARVCESAAAAAAGESSAHTCDSRFATSAWSTPWQRHRRSCHPPHRRRRRARLNRRCLGWLDNYTANAEPTAPPP